MASKTQLETRHSGISNNARSNTSNTRQSARVTLQVGERRFTTFRDTLTGESTYFRSRLSGRWDDAEDDGSYFIDSDPSIFEHVIGYLRSGNFPLFFDFDKETFDQGKYAALLGEARYFGIQKLEDWITSKRYLDAVKIYRTVVYHSYEDGGIGMTPDVCGSWANTKIDMQTESYTQKVYLCPLSKPTHRGRFSVCRQHPDCKVEIAVRKNELVWPDIEEESRIRVIVKKSRVELDMKVCLGDQGK